LPSATVHVNGYPVLMTFSTLFIPKADFEKSWDVYSSMREGKLINDKKAHIAEMFTCFINCFTVTFE